MVIDIETAGLIRDASRVLEVAGAFVQGKTIVDTFDAVIWPGEWVLKDWRYKESIEIHKLTPEKLRDGLSAETAAGRFRDWLDVCSVDVTAYPRSYDSSFLIQDPFLVCAPKYRWVACLMSTAIKRLGYKAKLGALAIDLGIQRDGLAHTGLSDAKVAAEILLKISEEKIEVSR